MGRVRSTAEADSSSAIRTTATTRFSQRGAIKQMIVEISLQSAQWRHEEASLNICNSEFRDLAFSADADQFSCKHGCQLCRAPPVQSAAASKPSSSSSSCHAVAQLPPSTSLSLCSSRQPWQLMSFVSSGPMKRCF